MNNEITSLEKLKEIEEYLSGIRYRKVENDVEIPKVNKNLFNKNEVLLENINKSCMELSKEVTIMSNNIRELLNIFKSALGEEITEESPESSDDLGSKLNTLVNQNNKLIERLDTMTQNMQINSRYDSYSGKEGDII